MGVINSLAEVKFKIEPCGLPLETSFHADLVPRVPVVLVISRSSEATVPIAHLHPSPRDTGGDSEADDFGQMSI